MNTKLVGIFLMMVVCATLVNSQYFSSHDGINLPRNGKRSSPLTNLVSYKKLNKPDKSLASSSLYKLHSPITFDRVYHQDKLSFRKYLKKFGKRYLKEQEFGNDYDYSTNGNNLEFDFIQSDDRNSNDKLMRKLIIDYLADKKVPVIVEMDDDSSSSSSSASSEEKINNIMNTEEKK